MNKQLLNERLTLYKQEERAENALANRLLFAASAVAGAGAMLIPPPAEAAIVYGGVQNKVVQGGNQQTVDFNGGGAEFTFNMTSSAPFIYTQKLAVMGTVGEVITSNSKPANLNSNYSISSRKSFKSINNDDLAGFAGSNYDLPGNFLGKQGYLGVKFEISGENHYGWIQYKANSEASIGTIIDWAYEDTPHKAIKTGDKGEIFNWNLFLPAITAGSRN